MVDVKDQVTHELLYRRDSEGNIYYPKSKAPPPPKVRAIGIKKTIKIRKLFIRVVVLIVYLISPLLYLESESQVWKYIFLAISTYILLYWANWLFKNWNKEIHIDL